MQSKKLAGLCALAAAFFAPLAAHASDWRPDGVVVQAGAGKRDVDAASIGLVWDSDWKYEGRVHLAGQTELFVSHWRAAAPGGSTLNLQQYTVLPLLRLQLDRRSPWYLELGIGASYLSKDYVTSSRAFSTRWNFYDVVGAGYRFGAKDRHELGLRYVHVSNLGIRKPNPGEDLVLLRYALKF